LKFKQRIEIHKFQTWCKSSSCWRTI